MCVCVCVCVCVCMCVCVCVCVLLHMSFQVCVLVHTGTHTHTHTNTQVQRIPVMSSVHSTLFPWHKVSHWTDNSSFQRGWLPRRVPRTSLSPSTSAGLHAHRATELAGSSFIHKWLGIPAQILHYCRHTRTCWAPPQPGRWAALLLMFCFALLCFALLEISSHLVFLTGLENMTVLLPQPYLYMLRLQTPASTPNLNPTASSSLIIILICAS
jgi:hypothetical protein